MPRWPYGKESGNDKVLRPSRQLHQQFLRSSTIRCILTSQCASKYFPRYQSPRTCECERNLSALRRLKNIFTKHDVTDEIDRTCLAAHSFDEKFADLQGFIQGGWNWQIYCLTDSKSEERALKVVKIEKKFPRGACSRTPLGALQLIGQHFS